MILDVSFKNLDPSLALKEKVGEKLEKLKEILSPSAKVHVTFWAHERKKVADILIHDHHKTIFAKAYSENFDKTIDKLRAKVRTQIVKAKDRLHLRKGALRMKENNIAFQ